MKNKLTIHQITILAMITAVTVVLSLLVIIPIPAVNGIVTILDAGIYFAGLIFGGLGGGIVGALSGLLIDMLSGYTIWAPFSLVIHGLQGWLFGYLTTRYGSGAKNVSIALVCSGLVMVLGYAVATEYLVGGGSGIASIPSNLLQVFFGTLITIVIRRRALSLFADKRSKE